MLNSVRKTGAPAREVLGIIHMDIFKLPFLESVVNNVVYKNTWAKETRVQDIKNANEVVEFHLTPFLVFITIKPYFINSVHVHNLNGSF